MKKPISKQLTLSGLLISVGVILPMVFHAAGGGGPVFLPMHIPVLLAGFFLSIPFALMVGALTPMLSSFITGMPPAFPMLPIMIFELATYAAVASLIYRKYQLNVYIALIVSMFCGRVVAGVMVWFLTTLFTTQLPGPIIFIKGAVATGIPGIIIQLIFIPAIVFAVNKYFSDNVQQAS
ncbi:ECF transporter S component [Proteinivorax tanatarense]|uniref:ECF transporter S component n=1 Tax=Proteinivorax tanatarense TaxID=1260629 RepID=A0AAU7VJV7_9FIRM